MTKKQVNIALEESDYDALKELSRKNKQSLSDTCRDIIRENIRIMAVDAFSRMSMVEKYMNEFLKSFGDRLQEIMKRLH